MKNLSSKKNTILLVLLIATNIIWCAEYLKIKSDFSKMEADLGATVKNKKIVAFQKLFVDKVLKSEGVVDFNTRVSLQNSVNDTEDQDIVEAWNKFLSAKTEAEGQMRVKELLSLLSGKIYGN